MHPKLNPCARTGCPNLAPDDAVDDLCYDCARRWRDWAGCRGTEDELWFRPAQWARAAEVCRCCPVIRTCLAEAMADEHDVPLGHRFGFRGGLTPEQRMGATRAARRARSA